MTEFRLEDNGGNSISLATSVGATISLSDDTSLSNLTLVDAGLAGPQGPAGSNANLYDLYLNLAANPDSLIAGTIVRDSNGAATSAPVVWPDGANGTYTATVVSSSFPGAVDAYTITYIGSPGRTYTQPTVTRDSTGAVTNRPAITVV